MVRAADCWDCCMWTGALCTLRMTTGEEGITSDLTVELWCSSEADVEPVVTDTRGDPVGTSAEKVLSTGTLATSGPF